MAFTDNSSLQFRDFLFSEELSDICLVVASERILAHKFALALKSTVFRNRFASYPQLNEYDINGVSVTSVKTFLRYVYTNEYVWDRTVETADNVMKLAHRFQVFDLSPTVTDQIISAIDEENYLSEDNFIALFELSSAHNTEPILAKVLLFGREKKAAILERELIRYESKERIDRLIQILGLTPSDFIRTVTNTLIQNSGRDKSEFEVFIDLEKCSVEDIFALNRNQLFVQKNLNELMEKKYLNEKKKFQALEAKYYHIQDLFVLLGQNSHF